MRIGNTVITYFLTHLIFKKIESQIFLDLNIEYDQTKIFEL